jgi:hypothetical protein
MSTYQLRRGSAAAWAAKNPVLAAGEPGYETGTNLLKVGDGVSPWTVLPYYGNATLPGFTGVLPIACSDEGSALTVGTAKVTLRMPFAFDLSAVRASLTTAQASGSTFTVDVKVGGASIFSTLLTIDNTEKTSTSAAVPAVLNTGTIADDAEITVDITTVGNGSAKGLKVYLIGAPS